MVSIGGGRFRLHLFVFLHVLLLLLLLPFPVYSADEEDNLLQGLNSYRQARNLPALSKNDNAGCLADEIANKLEDRPCSRFTGVSTVSGNQPQYANYPDITRKCKIDINTTTDGVILPVCVPRRVATLVLTNYTQSSYVTYLNNSRYTGVGIGKEDDWMVVVLSTNTPGGNFANGATSHVYGFQLSWYSLPLVLLGVVYGFLAL